MDADENIGIENDRIDVPDDVLDDLDRRLAATRWPDAIEGGGWDLGTDPAYLRELCEYWRTGFDWRAAEAGLNRWPQVTTTIDGQRLHALHVRSPEPEALPLLLTHGWPGSVVEFRSVLGPLTDPVAHGGDVTDAFHVVCPSLPGYGWSGPTRERGWDIARVARVLDTLMHRAGYDHYAAQGGDWGALATAWLGRLMPDHLVGLHLNMPIGRRPKDFDPGTLSAEQQARWHRATEFRRTETGYSAIQGTRPQSLAYGLTDSPAGLAGWIVEKFRAWSDCGGDVESVFSRDVLLTNITTYWVTRTAGSSARLYFESLRAGTFGPPREFVSVPTGVADFAGEPFGSPRPWVEAAFDLRRWTSFERGGHFAALEQPAALVDDIRAFFRPLR